MDQRPYERAKLMCHDGVVNLLSFDYIVFYKRPTACVTGEWENQLAKRNQTSRLNQVKKAEPTTRPVHALLGAFAGKQFYLSNCCTLKAA
jgi:hypothetical protein